MSHRTAYIGIAGAVALGIGLFLLGLPVYLEDYDQYGRQIPCGSGYSEHLVQATAAGDEYIGKCETAVLMSRLWMIPIVVIGAMALLAVLYRAAMSPAHESAVSGHDAE